MVPSLIICATLPSMFAAGCAALLAFKERKQWIWFALLSVIAGFAGLVTLNMLHVWNYAGRC
ncbi:hypothetical protein [Bradyrhizobium stylosanthis]|uniref:Uncharacterized protein n=1 Tax=Bradyrhizobium stylosanthis TaxID=1803665 RepID=A0A560DQX2_9BRAD|nr:hypothetical protein [Bradyrhizobium stylosanthis]TWA99520.1 hypothetical protein FBZ96_104496 [Bradyrhizobium stylosanthis]